MTVFIIITMLLVTLSSLSYIGEYEESSTINIICGIVTIAYIAACVFLISRGI